MSLRGRQPEAISVFSRYFNSKGDCHAVQEQSGGSQRHQITRCTVERILIGLSHEETKRYHVVMITKQQYAEYLICTIGNFTSSNLAEHLDDVNHDIIIDYLPDL
jgi:hypothetical protein